MDGLDGGINLFFHMSLWLNVPCAVFVSGLPIVYEKPSGKVNTMFCKFLGFPGRFTPCRNAATTIRMDNVDCSESALPLGSPESRVSKEIRRPDSRFQRWRFSDSTDPGAMPRLVAALPMMLLRKLVCRRPLRRTDPPRVGNSRVRSREFPQTTDRSYGIQSRLARSSRLVLQDNQSR